MSEMLPVNMYLSNGPGGANRWLVTSGHCSDSLLYIHGEVQDLVDLKNITQCVYTSSVLIVTIKSPARFNVAARTGNPTHRGLWFQTLSISLRSRDAVLTILKSNNCDFFRWIPSPSPSLFDPYAINPGQGPGDNDPFGRNEAFRSPTSGSPQINPTL
ncbi:hypothetical protein B0H17DRAFT_1142945 [Mycena rosella]|uniref:Uncharacterized protein n=1 Tax=Mycena rosella TaxID=1033263 RepID=A0AAD7CWR7_MYCRO|nr:hypothetical protein B0H17DRAFT_1142945 [Mycena rosella]